MEHCDPNYGVCDSKTRNKAFDEMKLWRDARPGQEAPPFNIERYFIVAEMKLALPIFAIALFQRFRDVVVRIDQSTNWEWAQYMIIVPLVRALIPHGRHFPIDVVPHTRTQQPNCNLFSLWVAALMPEAMWTYATLRNLIITGGLGTHVQGRDWKGNPWSAVSSLKKSMVKNNPRIGVSQFMKTLPAPHEGWSSEDRATIFETIVHKDVEKQLHSAGISELRMLVIYPTVKRNMIDFEALTAQLGAPRPQSLVVRSRGRCLLDIERKGLYQTMTLKPLHIARPGGVPNPADMTFESRHDKFYQEPDPAVLLQKQLETERSQDEVRAHLRHLEELREEERCCRRRAWLVRESQFIYPIVSYHHALSDFSDLEPEAPQLQLIMYQFHTTPRDIDYDGLRGVLQGRLNALTKVPFRMETIVRVARSINLQRIYDPDHNSQADQVAKLEFFSKEE